MYSSSALEFFEFFEFRVFFLFFFLVAPLSFSLFPGRLLSLSLSRSSVSSEQKKRDREKRKREKEQTPHRVALLEVARLPPEERPPERRVRKLERVERRGRALAAALAPAEQLEQRRADAVAEVLQPEVLECERKVRERSRSTKVSMVDKKKRTREPFLSFSLLPPLQLADVLHARLVVLHDLREEERERREVELVFCLEKRDRVRAINQSIFLLLFYLILLLCTSALPLGRGLSIGLTRGGVEEAMVKEKRKRREEREKRELSCSLLFFLRF